MKDLRPASDREQKAMSASPGMAVLACTKCACMQFIPQMWTSNKCVTCFHAVTSHAREGDSHRIAPPDALLQRSITRRQTLIQKPNSLPPTPTPPAPAPGSPKPPLPKKKKRGVPINRDSNNASPPPPPPPTDDDDDVVVLGAVSSAVDDVPNTPPSPPPGTPPPLLPAAVSDVRVYDVVPSVLPPIPTGASSRPVALSPRPKPLPHLPSPRSAAYATLYSPFTPLEAVTSAELQPGSLTTDVLRDYRRSLRLFSGTLPEQYRELAESDSKLVGSELVASLLTATGMDAASVEGLMDVVVLPHIQRVPRVLPRARLEDMRLLVDNLREYTRAQRVLRGVTLLQARVRGMLVRKRLVRLRTGSREHLRHCTAAYSVLLRTEAMFVADLTTLVNDYLVPLRQLQWTEAVSVFGNVEELLRAHRALLADLNRVADWQWPLPDSLADVFLKASATLPLKCVVPYVESYGRSTVMLQTLRANNAKFAAWLDATHDRVDEQRGHMYAGVEALLATPINRTTAYVRALSLFANEFACDADDRASLKAALAEQSTLADSLRSALERGIA